MLQKLTRTMFVLLLSVTALIAQGTIVDTAVKAGDFKTLVAAVKAAGLAETLSGKGPFTVFAPTDAAFDALPEGTLQGLLKPQSKARLTTILSYHVVGGSVLAKDVVKMPSVGTLLGQRAAIEVSDKGVTIAGALVTTTDIVCSNGVIHVIDAVMLPQSKDVIQVAKAAGKFNTLLTAAATAGLVPALTSKGPITVFAPSDDAFAKLAPGTVASLLKPENRSKLSSILKAHVVSGRVYADQAIAAKRAKALSGFELEIVEAGGAVSISGSKVVSADIEASNGVIHVIDSVIIPD